MKISDFIIEMLVCKKVRVVFGYAGGSMLHLLNSLRTNDRIKYVQLYHEQSAAFAADAYARVAQTPGAALSTSGPGATNLLTGVANAYFDSVPAVFITGQVSQRSMKRQPIRQRGFQEIDITAMASPVTKYAKTFESAEEILREAPQAMLCAESGRQGPVLLDLPHNLQSAEIPDQEAEKVLAALRSPAPTAPDEFDERDISQVCAWLAQARRPLVLAGGGVAAPNSRAALTEFAENFDLPVVASLLGLSALANDHPLFCGFIGSYGHRYANFCLANTDLLIVLGSRLDERQVGNVPEQFAPKARIVHVDIDPQELNHRIKADLGLCGEATVFMKKTLAAFTGPQPAHEAWKRQIKTWQAKYPATQSGGDREPNPNRILAGLDRLIAPDAVVCLDVGQNQMWAAQSLSFTGTRQVVSSSGHGAMGYALPASIGAAYAAPGRQIICVAGDGGFQMNLQELQAVVRDALPIKIFLLNNDSLGMIREFQERLFDGHCLGSVDGYSTPSFEKIAGAYDLPYTLIAGSADVEHLENLKNPGPHLFEIRLPINAPLEPYPRPYRPVEDQLPELTPEELEAMYAARNI